MSPSWSDSLRAAGLRVTRPRLAVAEALRDLGGHHSADEILEHLVMLGRPLPRASVYNVLDALVTAGIAVPAYHGPGRALFEIRGDDHDHFVCTRCDAVVNVAPEQDLRDATPLSSAVVDEVAVVYRGVCPDCA